MIQTTSAFAVGFRQDCCCWGRRRAWQASAAPFDSIRRAAQRCALPIVALQYVDAFPSSLPTPCTPPLEGPFTLPTPTSHSQKAAMWTCRTAALLVALLATAVLAAPVPAAGAVLAVDLGAEFLKLAIVKPGRIPISIVNNEMSKRKTPALVAFVEGDRLVGEEASSLAARYPERVFARLGDLLGRPSNDPTLTAMLKAGYRPYEVVPAANRSSPAAAALRTDRGDLVSAEEAVASLLEYAKGLAEADVGDGAPVTDAVITVPASFLPQQVRAARLAAGVWCWVWWRAGL